MTEDLVTKPAPTKIIKADKSAIASSDGAGDSISANDNSTVTKTNIYITSPDQLASLANIMSQSLGETEKKALAKRYLDYLITRYSHVQFKGMGINNLPLQIPLLALYVPLKARPHLPEGDCWSEELRLAGRKISKEELDVIGKRIGGPTSLLELLKTTDGLIVLGDPGSGKTTFLKYLALQLALGKPPIDKLAGYFPILLPLSDYAERLSHNSDLSLSQFFNDHYQSEFEKEPLGFLISAILDSGKGLVLLDGLDEVKDELVRGKVAERVARFYSVQHKKGNCFVMTSRVIGYQEVRPNA